MSELNDVIIDMLRRAVRALGPIADEVVFTGGATIPLYILPGQETDFRPTRDVDCVVKIKGGYHEFSRFEEKLRDSGLEQLFDEDGPICRWYSASENINIDIMPTDEKMLGFSNRWYQEAVSTAIQHQLGDEETIKIFHPLALVAAKIEAFRNRGKGDFYASHDFEDLITVIDGVGDLLARLHEISEEMRLYIAGWAREVLGTGRELPDIIDRSLGDVPERVRRADRVIEILRALAVEGASVS